MHRRKSKDPIRRKCTNKVRFAHTHAARIGAIRRLAGGERGLKLWAYDCEHCGGFHLTSNGPVGPGGAGPWTFEASFPRLDAQKA